MESDPLSGNDTIEIIRTIGSPFVHDEMLPAEEDVKLYQYAIANKIPLLYLESIKSQGKLNQLTAQYSEECTKHQRFLNAIAKVSRIFEMSDIEYSLVKTLKPYPSVPNDIDVIIMGDDRMYRRAIEALLRAHYIPFVEHLPYYMHCLKSNASNYRSFRDRLSEVTGFDIQNYDEKADLKDLFIGNNGQNFVKLFATGFGKWLLQLMLGSKIAWKVEMLNSCWYRVGDNHNSTSFPNMLSLIYCFTPINVPLNDLSRLVVSNPQPELNEESLAMGIIEKTDSFLDLDKKLDNDNQLFQKMMRESAKLLEKARYSVENYPEWVDQKTIHFAAN